MASGSPDDIMPFQMMTQLTKHYQPVLAFNDLALQQEFYQLQYQQFGAIDLLSAAIQCISAKILEVENIKSVTLKTQPILISEWDMIAVLIGTLPPEYDPEIKTIECEPKINFKSAVDELRSHEVKLQMAANGPDSKFESESVNAMANPSARSCVHCHKSGHSIKNCYTLHPELRNQSTRGRGHGNPRGRGG